MPRSTIRITGVGQTHCTTTVPRSTSGLSRSQIGSTGGGGGGSTAAVWGVGTTVGTRVISGMRTGGTAIIRA